MTSTNTDETLILKTDALGRVRMPTDRREAILDAFEQSGMSGQAFAKYVEVKYPTFATWIQKCRRVRGEHPQTKLPGDVLAPASPITFSSAHLNTLALDPSFLSL